MSAAGWRRSGLRRKSWWTSCSTTPARSPAAAATKPSANFASESYWSLDAFVFVDANGKRQPVRRRMMPESTRSEANRAGGADYLAADPTQRLAQGPLRWRLQVTLANPGGPTNDATKAGPDDRRTIDAGRHRRVRQPAAARALRRARGLAPAPHQRGSASAGAKPRYVTGRFATVWRRAGDGAWRVVFDGGDAGKPASDADVAAFHAGRQPDCPAAASTN